MYEKRLVIVGMVLIVLVAAAIMVLHAVDMKIMAENKPVLKLKDKGGNSQAECLFDSYCWK